ncbi:MAG: ABC transporter substrate-binding protein, partial [Sphingobacteriia bacterium]|nr:ABC transporter substrate-binding protein [Sphingobacteriia bacterium]
MKKSYQLTALLLCILMVTILFGGCSKSDKITIGISQFADHPSLDNCRNGFIEGLKQEGYVEGQNVTFDYQNAQTDMGIANQIAGNFVSKKYNLI